MLRAAAWLQRGGGCRELGPGRACGSLGLALCDRVAPELAQDPGFLEHQRPLGERFACVADQHGVLVVHDEEGAASWTKHPPDLGQRTRRVRVLEGVLAAHGVEGPGLETEAFAGHAGMELDAGEQ